MRRNVFITEFILPIFVAAAMILPIFAVERLVLGWSKEALGVTEIYRLHPDDAFKQGVAAQAMRHILVDYARARNAGELSDALPRGRRIEAQSPQRRGTEPLAAGQVMSIVAGRNAPSSTASTDSSVKPPSNTASIAKARTASGTG